MKLVTAEDWGWWLCLPGWGMGLRKMTVTVGADSQKITDKHRLLKRRNKVLLSPWQPWFIFRLHGEDEGLSQDFLFAKEIDSTGSSVTEGEGVWWIYWVWYRPHKQVLFWSSASVSNLHEYNHQSPCFMSLHQVVEMPQNSHIGLDRVRSSLLSGVW